MAHGYRKLQHWNQWLGQQFLGQNLLQEEKQTFSSILNKHFGKHALLIGVPSQATLLDVSSIPYRTLITSLISKDKNLNCIESDFHEFPILTGSIDLVMIPHTLEFVDNPRQLLAEACRIIKPEGLIMICGFNPYGAWGLKKILSKNKSEPWKGNFIHSYKVRSWLKLADFEMEKHQSILFTPPINHPASYKKLQFLERLVSKGFPALGGVYILLARAKVIPLTPIRLKWKQQLNGIRISTSITGHIARQFK